MPTGEDAHGSDYFTPVFLLPQLCNSTERRDFRNEIKKAIHDVQAVWPNCGIKADLEGVTVTKTSPSVEKKQPRLQLD